MQNNSFFAKIRSNKILNQSICFIMIYLQFYYPQLVKGQNPKIKQNYNNNIKYINTKNPYGNTIENQIKSQNIEKNKSDFFKNTKEINKEKIIKNINYFNPSNKDKMSFSADIISGTIGTDKDFLVDESYDNIFKINIERDLKPNENWFLEYDLYGLSEGFSATKSINDNPALGGYLINKNNNWVSQSEPLDNSLISKGINTIKFTTSEKSNYVYRIKNLKLVSKKQPLNKGISIAKNTIFQANEHIYFNGFVADKNIKNIEIEGKEISINQGNFECITKLNPKLENLEIKIIYTNGIQEIQKFKVKQVSFNNLIIKDLQKNPSLKKFINNKESENLILEKTSLNISKESLKESKIISISALNSREILPLTSDMTNVTSGFSGYRYLPHGQHFKEPVDISIGFDPKKIPQGYSVNDIQTFYFDETQKKWITLDKDSIDVKNNKIISKTNHFTDFINGVIQVPESPETGNYSPTDLNNIKAADPALGVVSVGPPTPNIMGSVTTSFPIKIPAGRQGMQPNLEVNYSSDAGNGWMGLGWNLSVPAITIDTSWGAPRYEADKESETYSFSGDQLTFKVNENYVLPHRDGGFNQPRTNDRQFFPRLEASYLKIIRKGDNPKNYYWEVTLKDGTVNVYGNTNNSNLKDDSENIGFWALSKTIDTNGNYIEYIYDNSKYIGNSARGARQFYISKINYTKNDKAENLNIYTIDFERELSKRNDMQINARLGFPQIIADRLTNIKISTNASTSVASEGIIRSYKFIYKEGAFNKTLLKEIQELDEAGNIFYSNKMDYEDHTNKGTEIFEDNPIKWEYSNKISLEKPFNGIKGFLGNYTDISGSKSTTGGFTFRAGIGFVADLALPNFNTIGAHGGANFSNSETMISLADIDGDNIPDRIYKKGRTIYYQKGTFDLANKKLRFLEEQSLFGIYDVGKSKSTTWNAGVSGNFAVVSLGFDYSNTSTNIKSYFMDFNNDGLADYVNNGKIYFNYLINNKPNFRLESTNTPNPIVMENMENNKVNFQKTQKEIDKEKREREETEIKNPVHDVVRVWVAPKSGTIKVENNFKLLDVICPEGDDCSYSDGIAVSFQHSNNNPLVLDINKGDFDKKNFPEQTINITKGEKLYFRISSKYDGKLDQIQWNPIINYKTNLEPELDSNNKNLNVYNAKEDFIVSNQEFFYASSKGTLNLNIKGNIENKLSDEIYLEVYSNKIIIDRILIENPDRNININKSYELSENQDISLKLHSDTNIDWKQVNIYPFYKFKEQNSSSNQEEQEKLLGFEMKMLNENPENIKKYKIQNKDIGKTITLESYQDNFVIFYNNEFTISAKSQGKLLAKTKYKINNIGKLIEISKLSYNISAKDLSKDLMLEISTHSDDEVFVNHLRSFDYGIFYKVENKITTNCSSNDCLNINKNQTEINGTINSIKEKQYINIKGNFNGNSYANFRLKINDNPENDRLFKIQRNDITKIEIPMGTFRYSYNIIFDEDSNQESNSNILIEDFNEDLLTENQRKWKFINHKIINFDSKVELAKTAYDNRLGLLYRGWGSFIVNSERKNEASVISMKIDETKLKNSNANYNEQNYDQNSNHDTLKNKYKDPVINENQDSDENEIQAPNSEFEINKDYFFKMNHKMEIVKDENNQFVKYNYKWIGIDPKIYIESENIKTSRQGEDNIDQYFKQIDLNYSDANGGKLNTIDIISKSKSLSVSAGISLGVAGLNGSKPLLSESWVSSSLSDMNGDGFPDVFNNSKVNYSNSLGFITDKNSDLGFMSESKTNTANSYGVSAGLGGFFHGTAGNSSNFFSKYSNNTTNNIKTNRTTRFISKNNSNYSNSAKNLEKSANEGVTNSKATGITLSPGLNYNQEEDYSNQMFVDINGDGLPDKYVKDKGIFLNLGYKLQENPIINWGIGKLKTGNSQAFSGGFGVSLFNNSFEAGLNYNASNNDVKQDLIDINSDGLLDHLIYNPNEVIVNLNTGTGFKPLQGNIKSYNKGKMEHSISESFGGNGVVSFSIPIFFIKLSVSAGVSYNTSVSRTQSTFMDVNGDGFTDFVTSDNLNNLSVYLSKIANTNMLKKVHLPMGGSWEVTYKRTDNSYEMPNSIYVMNSITINDGFSGDDDYSSSITKTTVSYENGYYSRREKQFYGFNQIKINQVDNTKNDEVFRYTIQKFKNKSYYEKGLLTEETLFDSNNNPWVKSLQTYAVLKREALNFNNSINLEPFQGDLEKNLKNNYSYFVSTKKTTKIVYESDGKQNKSTYSETLGFNKYGDITKFYDHGEGGKDSYISEVSYHFQDQNIQEKYVVGIPKLIQIKNSEGKIIRKRETKLYDNEFFPLVHQTILYNGNKPDEFIDQEKQVYSYEYDKFGNLSKFINSPNYKNESFYKTYKYDSKMNIFTTRIDDAFGYFSEISQDNYNYKYGVPLYSVDMNLQPMRTKLDSKGRIVEITGPNELFNEGLANDFPEQGKAWTIRFDYPEKLEANTEINTDSQWFATTRHFDIQNPNNENGFVTITISDGLGNAIQAKQNITIWENGSEVEYYSIPGKTKSDVFGRVYESYHPTLQNYQDIPKFEINGNNTTSNQVLLYDSTLDTSAEPTKIKYDIMDRIIKTKTSGENLFSTIEYSIKNNYFSTLITDELGHKNESFTDIKGRNVKTINYSNKGNIITNFVYDSINQIVMYEDIQGNQTKYTYDNLGRKITFSNPNSGIMKSVYDTSNNILSTTNSENEVVTYNYMFNRLDNISYSKNPQNNVNYYYGKMLDASAENDNTVGRLWYMTDASGTQYFKYGKNGEITYNRRSIAVSGKSFWFETAWKYDSWNRVQEITYPDSEKVSYIYNKSGSLNKMNSLKGSHKDIYVSQIGYDKFGQKIYLKYGNNTEMNYEYEDNRRRLLKTNSKISTNNLINNTYQYDVASNITSILSSNQTDIKNQINGITQHNYAYDDLYRLTFAQGSWNSKYSKDSDRETTYRKKYSLNMEYDLMYNIKSKSLILQENNSEDEQNSNWNDILNNPSYSLTYDYGKANTLPENGKGGPHALSKLIETEISNQNIQKIRDYKYDLKGNILEEKLDSEKVRRYLWDEENRLKAIDINSSEDTKQHSLSFYTYDFSGERIIKDDVKLTEIILNGKSIHKNLINAYTLYPSGMIVFNAEYNEDNQKWNTKYTKHYYIGSQRIISKIGKSSNLGGFLKSWRRLDQNIPNEINEINKIIEKSDQAKKEIYKAWNLK